MNSLSGFFSQCFRLCLSVRFSILLLLVLCAASASAQESRTWTSKNGKFRKQAVLVETNKDQVVLKLETGRIIKVPVEGLSAEDHEYLANRNSDSLSKVGRGKERVGEDSKSAKSDPIVKLQGTKLGTQIQKRIVSFHEGAAPSNEVLRIVYFHGSDTGPQANYRERLHGIIHDVQKFYFDEMKKNGFRATRKMPLELEDGKLVVHVVKGQNPTSSYSSKFDSARGILDECEVALRGKVEFESDYTLIVCGLVKKDGQSYIYNSPNYGLPFNHTRGCSFVPDCERFDVRLAQDTASKISYIKDDKKFTETQAKFTTKRLGGVAHELGHALNLTHNSQTKKDLSRKGTALMGYGNYSYRKQLWDKKSKGSFMTLAMSASLAAHPLFTGSDRGRWKKPQCRFDDVNYSVAGRKFEIKGVVKSDPAALAVIAFVDPAAGDKIRDYDATTWVGGVGRDGEFRITISEHFPGPHELRLAVLLANGATETAAAYQYEANEKGIPDVARLNSLQLIGPIERLLVQGKDGQAAAAATDLIEKFQADGTKPSGDLLPQLEHIVSLAEPHNIESLAEVDAKTVFLSDVQWESAEAGFGKPARNRVFANPRRAKNNKSGVLLQIGGAFHEKGLYGHANSSFVFNLDSRWHEFECVAGLQTGALGRVKFSVKG